MFSMIFFFSFGKCQSIYFGNCWWLMFITEMIPKIFIFSCSRRKDWLVINCVEMQQFFSNFYTATLIMVPHWSDINFQVSKRNYTTMWRLHSLKMKTGNLYGTNIHAFGWYSIMNDSNGVSMPDHRFNATSKVFLNSQIESSTSLNINTVIWETYFQT